MGPEERAAFERTIETALLAESLTSEEISVLESNVAENPNDLDSRVRLLVFYFSRRSNNKPKWLMESRRMHIAWMIDNYPDHPILRSPFSFMEPAIDGFEDYAEIKRIWVNHLQSGLCTVESLINAAYFLLREDKHLSEDCLLRAKTHDPNNPEVEDALNHLYHLWHKRPS